MTKIKNGGPAFPVMWDFAENETGMSLRDWFAAHADQPGRAEIISAAGLKYQTAEGPYLDIPDRCGVSFDVWWREMPQAERFRLCAKVRYEMADAMIAAREAEP